MRFERICCVRVRTIIHLNDRKCKNAIIFHGCKLKEGVLV